MTLEEQAIWSQLRASGGVNEEAWVWVSGLPEADAELRELRERVAGLLEVQMDSKEPKGLVCLFFLFCVFFFLFWCDSWGMTFPVALLFSGARGKILTFPVGVLGMRTSKFWGTPKWRFEAFWF